MPPPIDWVWPASCAALGAGAGTVANLCILRLPYDESPPLPSCPGCAGPRRVLMLLPVLGWPYRRCRQCRSGGGSLTAIELTNAAMWTLLALLHRPLGVGVIQMVLVTSLLVLMVVDLRHYILPDAITLPAIVAGIGVTWLPGWPVSLVNAALSASIGYFAMMALAAAAESYYGEEALGQGDWKLVAMLGAFLGASKLLMVILIANAAGAAVGLFLVARYGQYGRRKLPLGTFLGGAGILMVFA